MKKSLLTILSVALILMLTSLQNLYGQTYHQLSSGSLTQDWSNTSLITTNDDWSGLNSIRGFLGDDGSTTTAGTDPQTIIVPFTTLDVIANLTNTTSTAGGVGEFEIADPTVGLQGSGTADYPHIVLYLNTTGCSNILVKYDLRDIDGTADNATQPVALQYRVGSSGDFTNIPSGFVADATTGPSLATQVTHINVMLPVACNNQAEVQVRIITANAGGSDEWVGIDNIVVEVDATPPVATFNPVNASTGVAVNVTPVITFDEPVRKTDGSELTNADLSTLVTLKETDASGSPVAFTGTIDAAKKVITVTPSASLKNNQVYYLAVGPVEDAAGNESTLKSITFTTINATTPTVTVIYPNGGEVFYSGDLATVTWTTTNFDAGENVKIEVWLPESVWYTIEPSTPNDGSQVVTVGPEADYGTAYKIRISGVTNGATDESDNPFTIIATSSTLEDLKTYSLGSKIRYTGEAVITFIRTANRNQKYLQDATGGLLIDDPSGILTTTLAIGDKITGLEGTLGTYTGMFQLVPKVSSVTVVSSGNAVTVPTLTIPEYTANWAKYESMLIRIANLTFPAADGSATFAASTQYTVTDGTNNLAFYTFKAGEGNPAIVGTVIPSGNLAITGLALRYDATIELSARSTSDFEILSAVEKTSAAGQVKLYPVPSSSVLNISGTPNLKSVDILDAAGKLIRTINTGTEEVVRIPVGTLKSGTYMIRLNTADGTVIKRFVKQ